MEGSNQQTSLSGGTTMSVPLFATAAHELKSPLALIRQLSLCLESVELSDAEKQKIINQITLTSEKALRLTSNLTKSVRLDGAMFALEPINSAVICSEAINEIRPLYRARGRQIVVRKSNRSLLGIANRDLLRRILINFADNALHYSDDNNPVVLSASTRRGGEIIRFSVRDKGPVLASGSARHVGETPEQQIRRPESSGLGIFIAKQFADSMNATIGSINHKDGATYYVDINVSHQMRLL